MGQTTQVQSATGPLAPSEASSANIRYVRVTEIVDPIANPKKKRRELDLNALGACLSKSEVCLEAYCFQARPSHATLGGVGAQMCQNRPFADTGIWKHSTGLTRTSELVGLDRAPR